MTTRDDCVLPRAGCAHRRYRRRRHRAHRYRDEPCQYRDGRARHPRCGRAARGHRRRHSVNIPCIRAFAGRGPIHILQIDAHLDFVDVRHGVRHGHGNPMRRAAEQAHVTGITALGIRNVSSTTQEGYEARGGWMGDDILSVRQVRKLGVEGVLARPSERRAALHHDRHRRLLPSIAPGTGHAQSWRFPVLRGAGDPAGRRRGRMRWWGSTSWRSRRITTRRLYRDPAAQVLLNLLGFIFHARSAR